MYFLLIFCLSFALTASTPKADSPILKYLAENGYVTTAFVLNKKDDATLKKKVVDPTYFPLLLKGKVPFKTIFLVKYKTKYPSPKLIVANYVKQVELNFLNYVHNILAFFYKPNGNFANLDGLFIPNMDEDEHIDELENMVRFWTKHSPSGRDNIKEMLTHLQNGPLDAELLPFITKLSTHVKKQYPDFLMRIDKVIESANDLDILPKKLYHFLKGSFTNPTSPISEDPNQP